MQSSSAPVIAQVGPIELSRRRRRSFRVVAVSSLCTVLATALLLVIALQHPSGESAARRIVGPKKLTVEYDARGLRQILIETRYAARSTGDVRTAAQLNGIFSREALRRAHAVHTAWLERKVPGTALYSQKDGAPEWNYRNTAADFFAFHLLAGLRLNPGSLDSLMATLKSEEALRTSSGLCQPVRARDARQVEADHDELLFGSSEYLKDGLLSVLEWHGPDIVLDRMLSITDAIIAESRHNSRFGPIVGKGAEVNGNMMVVCTRLSYVTGRSDYAEYAARIADAVVHQMLPANSGLPPRFFDFEKNEVIDPLVHLKDHGNEVMFGLSEAYAMAVHRSVAEGGTGIWSDRVMSWAGPIARMYDLVLQHGARDDGLLANRMHASPPSVAKDTLNDNWGYVLNGATLFVQAGRRSQSLPADLLERLDGRIDQIARSTFAKVPRQPFSGSSDSDCDAVESALYMAAYRPHLRQTALGWADEQMQFLMELQLPSGLIDGIYLDGNYIRTMLLYADARSGGWQLVPWSANVSVGFAIDAKGIACLTVTADQPYRGRLVPDGERHRLHTRLPWDWPRLNSWPRWWIPGSPLVIVKAEGLTSQIALDGLAQGIDLELERGDSFAIWLRSNPE